ncbi:MAG: hypothetical protein FWE91_03580 [Defluviitaleaceae bacterium]|nr:hypothetical protein [Defluviitaleaceae bacterium]MCL2835658.1 hypothetical protein [Defluviitaleaceae bacterium]
MPYRIFSILAAFLFFCALVASFTAKPQVLNIDKIKTPKGLHIGLAVWIILVNGIFLFWAFHISPGVSLTHALENIWYNTIDANNYADIARHWYNVYEGSELPYKIVFFPLYAAAMRAVRLAVKSYPVAGMLVSSACAYFGGVLLWRLAYKLRLPNPTMAVVFLFLFPSAFFLMVPMTESLFLLLAAACFYFLTDKKYFLAGLMGFLAALTRSQGLLLALPIAIELLPHVKALLKTPSRLIRAACAVSLPALGFGVYLLINLRYHGNPFQFMEFQREHWHQQMGLFWNTAAYLPEYMRNYLQDGYTAIALGLSLPNIAAFWTAMLLILAGAKRLRPSITIWALAYFAMSFGPTWLLSGPRYISCLFPLALAVSSFKNKYFHISLAILYSAGFVSYLYAFINRFFVY